MGLETAFIAFAAASTAASVYSSSQQSKNNRRAAETTRRQQALEAAVNRRREQKTARQAAALVVQGAENQGVGHSSGAQGGQGSVISQLNANLSFLDRQSMLADQAGNFLDKAARWEQWANTFAGLSELAFAGSPYATSWDKKNPGGISKMFQA